MAKLLLNLFYSTREGEAPSEPLPFPHSFAPRHLSRSIVRGNSALDVALLLSKSLLNVHQSAFEY